MACNTIKQMINKALTDFAHAAYTLYKHGVVAEGKMTVFRVRGNEKEEIELSDLRYIDPRNVKPIVIRYKITASKNKLVIEFEEEKEHEDIAYS